MSPTEQTREKPFGIACYICDNCKHCWGLPPGPHKGCPKCGHIYSNWINFKQWQEAYEKYKM